MLEMKRPGAAALFAFFCSLLSILLFSSCQPGGEPPEEEPLEHSDIYFAFSNASDSPITDITVRTGTTVTRFPELGVGGSNEYQEILEFDETDADLRRRSVVIRTTMMIGTQPTQFDVTLRGCANISRSMVIVNSPQDITALAYDEWF
jgi:hypothetical protein